MTDGPPRTTISAWRPSVPGIAEVFHAHFTEHAYPAHTHDTWALMILNDGAVDFACDRHRHGVTGAGTVVLLPPGVSHDGRTVTASGFRKRVLYLDAVVLPEELTGRAVDGPVFGDALLRQRIQQLHTALGDAGDAFEAESRLAFVRERLHGHLAALRPPRAPGPEANRLAAELRDLLDSRLTAGLSLQEAAGVLHAHPTHLIRCFKQTYGLPPHAYLTGKRIERARGLLLDGRRPAEVAATVGFHDQAHLHRHFIRHVGTTPARYALTRPSR
ncbi:helix-turn-helix domain-containing protein [Streptomyces sp. NPDC058773]|uniref:helix-turn-helix domain-containing protein n=1 Tax=Streptomyces sp. NPDC058773 TaxID=3346632 RepID=UPI0036BA839D